MNYLQKTKHEYKNLKKQEIQHGTAYGNFEDLPRRTASDKTSKFKWMLDNIRAGKIISTPVWTTSFFFYSIRFQVSALLDVTHGTKLQSCAISRKTNDATLRKWQKF